MCPQDITAAQRLRTYLRGLSPAQKMLLGYLSYVVVGWMLLCLPVTHQVSGLSILDHLFISTSAVSTTGLVTISVSGSYNFFGELIVLGLIQLGGIGYMTVGSFLVLSRTSHLSPDRARIGRAVFNLPESFPIGRFVYNIVTFTLVMEGVGALLLYGNFRNAGFGIPHSAWSAIFHSVSAFCTAGFGLYNNSFESYAQHAEINLIIAGLSYIGGIGFLVFADIWNLVNSRTKMLTLTTKVIAAFTGMLAVGGTIMLWFFEPSLHAFPPEQRLLPAFFQTMTAMTTVGFNTVPIGALSKASILLITMLMVIGASPAGTGGGLKSTTFATVIGAMGSVLRGRSDVRFWGHAISVRTILMAMAGLGFYLTFLIVGTYLLEATETMSSFDENLFEAASALGTVGLSMGITASLSVPGKLIIILLMFCGRLGPLTLGIGLFASGLLETGASDPELVV